MREHSQTNGEGSDPPFYRVAFSVQDDEAQRLSLVDLLLVMVRNRRLVVIMTSIGLVVGLYSVLFPGEPTFQSTATLVRETERTSNQTATRIGMLGLGGIIGSSPTGLSAATYPELIQSREVRLSVVRDTFYISNLDSSVVLSDYLVRPRPFSNRAMAHIHRYTLGVLSSLTGGGSSQRSASPAARRTDPAGLSAPASDFPTQREESAIGKVRRLIDVKVDEKTGIMRVSAATPDPRLSSDLTKRLIFHLQNRIDEIETEKARQNLTFIQERFEEVGLELSAAEEELAAFMDRNMAAASARLQVDRQRLQRKVDFKAQLYGQLQSDLVQAEMELQRRRPVVTIVEQPVPATAALPGATLSSLFISILIGFVLGVGIAFVRWLFVRDTQNEAEKQKMMELREVFAVDRWRAVSALKRIRSRRYGAESSRSS